MEEPKHPAKYSTDLIPIFAKILKQYDVKSVLDPMAGVGRIAEIREHGYEGVIVANEIEREWAQQIPLTVEVVYRQDAANMSCPDGEFDAIVTSPTYGNRMADSHDAKDGSRRYTYTHMLGRKLDEANTGQMQWGEKYREKHKAIWRECIRVLKPDGIFVLNCKDHIRGGEIQNVSYWNMRILTKMGCELIDHIQVKTPGMRNGANSKLRVEHEDIWVCKKEA